MPPVKKHQLALKNPNAVKSHYSAVRAGAVFFLFFHSFFIGGRSLEVGPAAV